MKHEMIEAATSASAARAEQRERETRTSQQAGAHYVSAGMSDERTRSKREPREAQRK